MSAGSEHPALVLLTALTPRMREQLALHFELHDNATLTDISRQALAPRVKALLATALSVITEAQMQQWPALEMIAVLGVGTDGIAVEAAAARGIRICNTPEVSTEDIADHALALLLATTRQLVSAHQFVQKGHWQQGRYPPTLRFWGQRLGIVGLGRIGSAVARRALAFDMQIAYTGRTPKPDTPYRWYDSAQALAAEVDFLVICASGGPSTQGLIDDQVLKALGPRGVLVNIARGSIVDETALIEALQSQTIAAAGLDVFWQEPQVPTALLALPNVVLTPHMASATASGLQDMMEQTVHQLVAYFAQQTNASQAALKP